MKSNTGQEARIGTLKINNKYYWYREELSQICKSSGLEYRVTKQELNYIIEQYFRSNLIKKSSIKNEKKQVETINLDTPLLECGFSFNTPLENISPFKFTADMATAWRKVKRENSCNYLNKLKVASILWKEVRNSKNEKIYSKNLLTEYEHKIKEYHK
ncbi:SAP domain-containing protein [Peptostreptococcus stomatis]|nr:SAP domain-containing protein [uncultured Peptostreptococcus sp.]